jgi:hypothetical protein
MPAPGREQEHKRWYDHAIRIQREGIIALGDEPVL